MKQNSPILNFFLENFFIKNKKGYFLELGARDGKAESLTFALEKQYEWDGLCIEPNPIEFKGLTKHRSCHCLNYAISERSCGPLEFISLGSFSGFLEFSKKWRNKLLKHKKENPESVYFIKAKTLNFALSEVSAPKFIDFFALDVEGAELSVLLSLDLEEYKFGFIAVEHNFEQPKRNLIYKLLTSHGYTRYPTDKISNLAPTDDIYINSDIKKSLER